MFGSSIISANKYGGLTLVKQGLYITGLPMLLKTFTTCAAGIVACISSINELLEVV